MFNIVFVINKKKGLSTPVTIKLFTRKKKIDNDKAKKGQKTIHKIQQIYNKTEQDKPTQNLEVNSNVLEG